LRPDVEFQVFKKGKIVKDFAVHGAYIFGTDGIAVRRTQISFNNGTISCAKPNMETAGLALLWPVEGFGKVLLPTTCLPDRSRPYILNLELARAKLKQVVNKREDWSFFGGIEGLEDIAKEAQDLFIKAIQNISDTSLASKLADESLKKAMVRRRNRCSRREAKTVVLVVGVWDALWIRHRSTMRSTFRR
jgi:hypothetical protein